MANPLFKIVFADLDWLGHSTKATFHEASYAGMMYWDCDWFREQTPELQASCKRSFEEHNMAVKAAVSAERLLVFDLKMGWNPLCTFLGVPEPSVPFPHKDFSVYFQSEQEDVQSERSAVELPQNLPEHRMKVLTVFLAVLLSPLVATACCCFFCCKRQAPTKAQKCD